MNETVSKATQNTRHILIFDDNPADSRLYEILLEEDRRYQYECRIIEYGDLSIEIGNADAVIIDYKLPGSNGLEILEALTKSDPVNNPIPAIMITGLGNESIAAESMIKGAQDYLAKCDLTPEKLVNTIEHAINRAKIKKEIIQRNQRLENLVIKDELTGVYNRRYFDLRIEQEIQRAQEYNEPLCLLMIDIDYFKKVNDEYGHQIGDEVLKIFSGLLETRVRLSDVLSRYGGEEFCVILPITYEREAAILAQNIVTRISEEHININLEQSIKISCSIGLAEYRAEMTAEEFIKSADKALYQAKEAGRNQMIIALDDNVNYSNVTRIKRKND